MSFKLWLESFLNPDVITDIRTKLDKDGYVSVFIHGNGIIDTEYPDYRNSVDKRNRVGEVWLNDKNVNVKDIAGKITPQTQKLIKALMNAGVIDNTWAIKSKQIMPAAYFRGSEYKHLPSQTTQKGIDGLLKEPPLTKISQDLTLYHGTSSVDWDEIQKQGAIKPLFMGSKVHGFESRAKHDHNKNHIYLATDEGKAWEFALARARGLSRKLYPKQWDYNQHTGPANWPIKPVLLKIDIPDIGKLRTDDDVVNRILVGQSRKIWDAKSDEEKKKLIKIMSKAAGFDISGYPDSIWRETARGFKEILTKIKPAIYKAYFASIMKSGQVAYDGFVPLKFIQEIPFIQREE